jgi:hypothetical protein
MDEEEVMKLMPVTDPQAATLRALLAGDIDEHRRLLSELSQESDRDGYSALIAAAFFEATDRRFASAHTRADIVEFVTSTRAASDVTAKNINPLIAERMIRGVFEDESVDDVSGQVIVGTQLLLLAALVSEARFDSPSLDAFMTESRKLADRWLD